MLNKHNARTNKYVEIIIRPDNDLTGPPCLIGQNTVERAQAYELTHTHTHTHARYTRSEKIRGRTRNFHLYLLLIGCSPLSYYIFAAAGNATDASQFTRGQQCNGEQAIT